MYRESADKLRTRQIQVASATFRKFARIPGGPGVLQAIRRVPGSASLYRAILGYMQPFDTLDEAHAALSRRSNGGHANLASADLHLELNRTARPSDYPVLFHLSNLLGSTRRVFDLGGNVGNLFYCYSQYLTFPETLEWRVCDVAEINTRGRELAAERRAGQLAFCEDWRDASGCDVLIASGSLHYFAEPLPEMIRELPEPPQHIIANRTPFTQGRPLATVQDAGEYRVACMLYNRDEMLRDFERIGYRVIDRWDALERSLEIPGYPEHRVASYSGFYVRR